MSTGMKTFVTLTLLLALAFFLRWQYVLNSKFDKPIRADAREYVRIAGNLATSHVFSMTANPADSDQPTRPPGYPMFLAVIFALTNSFRSFHWTTIIIQCLLGAATVVITYVLASYALPRPWATITALLAAFSPHLIVTSAFLLTECLYTFLLLAGLTLLVKACRDDTLWVFWFAGFTLSLAIFVRPALAIFPLLCAATIYFHHRQTGKKRKTTVTIATFLLACFLIPAGWSLWRSLPQNARPSGRSLLKVVFVTGTYPNITYRDIPGMPNMEDPNFEKLVDSSYPEIAAKIATDIAREPARYLRWWLLGKPAMFWSGKEIFIEENFDGINFYSMIYTWFDNNSFMGGIRWLMLKLQPVLVILAALSIPFFIRGHDADLPESSAITTLLCLVLLGYFTLMFMVLAPFTRYAMPLGPELFLLAVLAVRNLSIMGKTVFSGMKG